MVTAKRSLDRVDLDGQAMFVLPPREVMTSIRATQVDLVRDQAGLLLALLAARLLIR